MILETVLFLVDAGEEGGERGGFGGVIDWMVV